MKLFDRDAMPITRSRLWQGATIGTLAEVVGGSGEGQRWEGMTYLLDNMSGWTGAIYFGESETIGAFFAADSSRNPFPSNGLDYDVTSYFAGMPPSMWRAAEDNVLRYLTDTLGGQAVPVITAAFWGEGDSISAAESWSQMYWNGVVLIDRQLMPPDTALAAWRVQYSLSDEQVAFIRSLVHKRFNTSAMYIVLNSSEWDMLKPENANYIDEVRASLQTIGFRTP
jgi:hypothetical protein